MAKNDKAKTDEAKEKDGKSTDKSKNRDDSDNDSDLSEYSKATAVRFRSESTRRQHIHCSKK